MSEFKQGELIEVQHITDQDWWKAIYVCSYNSRVLVVPYHYETPKDYDWVQDITGVYASRKIEKTLPTHEEITTKWWKIRGGDITQKYKWDVWIKVSQYHVDDETKPMYNLNGHLRSKKYFKDLESADIPPGGE